MSQGRWLLATLALNSCNLIPAASAIDFDAVALGPAAGLIDAQLGADGATALLYGDRLLLRTGGGAASTAALPSGFVAAGLSPVREGAVFVNGQSAGHAQAWRVRVDTGGTPVLVYRWGWLLGETSDGPVGITTAGCLAGGFYVEPPPCNVCCVAAGCAFDQSAWEACISDPNSCYGWSSGVGAIACDPNCPPPPPYDPNWLIPAAQGPCNFAGGGVTTPAWAFADGIAAVNLGFGAWGTNRGYAVTPAGPIECWADGDLYDVAIVWQSPFAPLHPYTSGGDIWFQQGGTNQRGDIYGPTWTAKFRPIASNGAAEVGFVADLVTLRMTPALVDRGAGGGVEDLSPWLDAPRAINGARQIVGVRGAEVVRLTPQ